MIPAQLIVGDPRHGVVRYAGEVADATGAPRVETPGDTPLHLHFTDRVWGASPAAAAQRVAQIAARAPLTVTLHDLPQEGDRPERIASYRRVAQAARGVVVNSDHERSLLAELVDADRRVTVVPLPVDRAAGPDRQPALDDEIAIVGFVYPGKGHAQAIDTAARVGGGLGVTALGGPATGHGDDVEALAERAHDAGVRLTVTGYLPEDELLERCRRAAVPLAAHRRLSASGSIGTWIAAGRRPLVADSRYARELAALRPGTVTLYDPAELIDAVTRAREQPDMTRLPENAPLGPGIGDVAAAYLAWWADEGAW